MNSTLYLKTSRNWHRGRCTGRSPWLDASAGELGIRTSVSIGLPPFRVLCHYVRRVENIRRTCNLHNEAGSG